VLSGSECGYQTRSTFENYVKEYLINELEENGVERSAQNPILYFLDGHKSHYSYEFSVWCREQHIHIITFFPNATRILQMCDVGMFGAGQKAWTKSVREWKGQPENRDKEIDEVAFVKILKQANDSFIKPESIINAFKATGIYPFNVENVQFDRCLGANTSAASLDLDITGKFKNLIGIFIKTKNNFF
jgi:hypothetical protein